jgi:tripartite-type tricarboxylate transporter receptor subunit TctC
MTDLRPIGQIGSDYGNPLIVNAASPSKNLKDLIAYAKSQSGGINYGSWGIGSGRHLVMETLKEQTGISMNHVPYKTVALFEQKQNSPAPLQKSPEAFAAMIQSEPPAWRKLMQTTKIEGA